MTAAEFAARLALCIQPGVLYREAGALRVLRCGRWPDGRPLFPDPAAALAAAWKAGWLIQQPPYPEDFYFQPPTGTP